MVRSLILIALMLALIGLASSMPGLRFSSVEAVDFAVRKIGHVVVYLALGVLVSRIVFAHAHRPTTRGLAFAGVILLMAAIAIADEANQSTVRGRDTSVVDVALDCGGALAGVVLHLRSRPLGAHAPIRGGGSVTRDRS
jgi:VanZ family protein